MADCGNFILTAWVVDFIIQILQTWIALFPGHYLGVIMSATAFQITLLSIGCSTVCSVTGQIKHQSSASLDFLRGIHRWPVNSLHKGSVMRKLFPFDEVFMDQMENKTLLEVITQQQPVTWSNVIPDDPLLYSTRLGHHWIFDET